jgi:hypothetical protein
MASEELQAAIDAQNAAIQAQATAAATIARIRRREEKLAREAAESERDKMISATLQALTAMDAIRREKDFNAAREQTARWMSNGRRGYIALGSYGTQRANIFDLMVKLDLVDAETTKFKFGPGTVA